MNFSTLSIRNGEALARVLANTKRALEHLFFFRTRRRERRSSTRIAPY